ncbi:MAG: lipase [Oscillospiraceae bacterium]|nr:lipase [Oscillospiraceae bacterium]
MKIICFGDSNTFGYDPRSYFGGRYSADSRWVDILAEKSGWEIKNYGQNGRSIPGFDMEYELLGNIFEKEKAQLLIIMLGSNDLLQGLSAKSAAARMGRFIKNLHYSAERILLVAPPPFKSGAWVETEAQIEASEQLSEHYRELAGKLGIAFADAAEWDVQLCHDGVHFTERGHRAFAAGIFYVIKDLKEI